MKGRMDCKRAGGKVEAKPEEKESGEYRRGGRKPELKHGGAVKGERPKMRMDRRARGGALSAHSAKNPYSDGNSKPPADRTPYKRGGAIKGEKEAEEEEDELASGGRTGDHWIAGAIKRPGALHRALHVPEGEKIPAKKMAAAAHSDNPRVRKEAALAHTLKSFQK